MSINAGGSREINGGNSRNSADIDQFQKANTINSISNNANLKDFNQNFKIREFEWFEVETKIRKFVNELLQPTIKKISIDKKLLDDINDKIDKNNDSVKCLHDIIHYNNDGVKVIDHIYQKIATTNSNLEILSNKHNQQQERILNFEQNILKDFQHIKDEMKEVHKSRDKFQEDKNSLIEYFESFKKNTQDIISSLNKEITSSSQWTKQEFSKSWEQITKIDHQTNQNQQEISINNTKIIEIFEKLTQINIKNQSFDNSMEQANKAIQTMQININTAKKLTNKIEELMNKFKMVENYIEKYSTLYVQGQISDTLFSVLDKSSKRKLIQYEDKAFATMNQVILNDDGIPNLNQKIEDSINYLERIVKRNAKYLQQKTNTFDDAYQFQTNQNEASIPFGFGDTFRKNSNERDSIDEENFNNEQKSLSPFSSNTIQPQNTNIEVRVQRNNSSNSNRNQSSSINNNNNISSQNQVNTPINSVNNTNNNNNTIMQPQNKVNTQHSKRSSVNSLNSQQRYDVSNKQFGQLKLMIDLEVQRMKEAIENKTTNLQNGLLENEEIMQINISKIQEEMEKGINILKQQNNNVLLETGVLDKKISGIWNELEKIVNTFNILSETVHKLIHFNTLSNSLVLQDELDKQSIALYGFRCNFSDDPKMIKTLRNPAIMASTSPGTSQSVPQKTLQKGAFPNLILDQNCLSCSGQSAQINQAFKVACLAYNPSTVNIDGRSYKREEVLEVATRLLQAARQQYGLKQNVNDFQELSQIESSSQNDVLDVSLNRNDQINQNNDLLTEENKQTLTNVNNKVNNNSAVNTQNSALDNVRTAVTQNSASSFTHNGRFYINSQLSNDQQQFRTNYANTSQNNASFLNQQNKIQNILPQLEGLKPRSRAISKNKQVQNNQQRIGSSQRREHTHH